MNWKRTGAVLGVAALAVTGTAFAQNNNPTDNKAPVVSQDSTITIKYDTLKQLQEQEKALNQQLSEKGLTRQLKNKIRALKHELMQKFSGQTNQVVRQKIQSEQAELKTQQTALNSAQLEIRRLQTERLLLQQHAATFHNQHNDARLAGVMDKVIQLERQIIAAKQELLKK